MKIQITTLDILPRYAHPGDAGFDLQAAIPVPILLHPASRLLIPCGFKMALPEGYVGLVVPRSGLALKKGIKVTNSPGVIDAIYRGEIGVILENSGHEDFHINPLDRIAQMVIVPILTPDFEYVKELDDTTRGEGGFGSTS